jgi:hypothetical protein
MQTEIKQERKGIKQFQNVGPQYGLLITEVAGLYVEDFF